MSLPYLYEPYANSQDQVASHNAYAAETNARYSEKDLTAHASMGDGWQLDQADACKQ